MSGHHPFLQKTKNQSQGLQEKKEAGSTLGFYGLGF
jgi:hypothetical protein